MHKRVIAGSVCSLLLALPPLRADDGAASIAAGGIVMKRESRITMAKEVLRISETKVLVDYAFRNDTDQDIATEVAFPISDYSFDPNGPSPQNAGFDDFKLWVDGTPARYTTEAHALLGKQDVTTILAQSHVDVASLAHYYWDSNRSAVMPDIRRLSTSDRNRLASLKLIDQDDSPLWRVRKKYHWSQTFPAHSTVHIRHEYTPVLGNSNTVLGTLVSTGRADENDSELTSVCPTSELLTALRNDTKKRGHTVGIEYVDFILTTANTWKTPIEDFTLIVERPARAKDPNHPATPINFVSFCWNGPIEKLDPNHFRVHVTGFVPKKELRVGFLDGYLMAE